MVNQKQEREKEFTGLRAMLWPIHGYELKKLFPLLLMFACIAFSYSMLRSVKDSVILDGATDAGDIPLVKAILVLPAAVLWKDFYNYLRSRVSDKATFSIILSIFVGFFAVFGFIFHPYMLHRRVAQQRIRASAASSLVVSRSDSVSSRASVVPDQAVDHSESSAQPSSGSEAGVLEPDEVSVQSSVSTTSSVRSSFVQLILAKIQLVFTVIVSRALRLIRLLVSLLTERLDQTVFYIMSELWGSMLLSLLFWGFVNTISRGSEPSRFYPLLGLSANIATSMTRLGQSYFSGWAQGGGPRGSVEYTIYFQKCLSMMLLVVGVVIFASYHWLNHYVLTDPRLAPQGERVKKKKGTSSGLIQGVKYVLSDPYLRSIAFMVVAYGIMTQMIEIVFKQQLTNYLENKFSNIEDAVSRAQEVADARNRFNSTVTSWTGFVAGLLGFLGSGNIIRHLGWRVAALVTPVMMLVTGSLSLGVVVFEAPLQMLFSHRFNALWIGVLLGALQGIFSKGIKYTLFDSTKEMTYIPLDGETKNRAKAEIDVVGARLGKAGGAVYNTILIHGLAGGEVLKLAPFSLIIVLGLGSYWIYTLGDLWKRYSYLSERKAQAEAEALLA